MRRLFFTSIIFLYLFFLKYETQPYNPLIPLNFDWVLSVFCSLTLFYLHNPL